MSSITLGGVGRGLAIALTACGGDDPFTPTVETVIGSYAESAVTKRSLEPPFTSTTRSGRSIVSQTSSSALAPNPHMQLAGASTLMNLR